MKKFFVAIVAILTVALPSFADSPLTSTDFYKAYANESIVQAATKCNGKISKEVMAYLSSDKNPIGVKVAAINALYMCAEETAPRENCDAFVKYLIKNCNFQDENGIIGLGSASVLTSMAYLMALDNFSNVQPAADIIYCAMDKEPDSMCVNMIAGLIVCESFMDNYLKWGKIYPIMNSVRSNTSFKQDMSEDALDAIMDYIEIYKD